MLLSILLYIIITYTYTYLSIVKGPTKVPKLWSLLASKAAKHAADMCMPCHSHVHTCKYADFILFGWKEAISLIKIPYYTSDLVQ